MSVLPLLAWLSPSFPIGAFAYSGGLEAAVGRGLVATGDDVAGWLDASLVGGAIRTDCLAATLAATGGEVDELDGLLLALSGSPTREAELVALGHAFVEAAAPWWPDGLGMPRTYPVALGTLAAARGLAASQVPGPFALATVTNAVQAAQRLLPIGQRDGVRIIHRLEATIAALAGAAAVATVDDLTTSTPLAEICALAHPTVEPRLFRS